MDRISAERVNKMRLEMHEDILMTSGDIEMNHMVADGYLKELVWFLARQLDRTEVLDCVTLFLDDYENVEKWYA